MKPCRLGSAGQIGGQFPLWSMDLLRPQLDHLRGLLLGLPHTIRESWPLRRFPRSRDWELLIVSYLIAVALLLILYFTFGFGHNTPYGL